MFTLVLNLLNMYFSEGMRNTLMSVHANDDESQQTEVYSF